MVSVDIPKYAVDLLRLSVYLDFEKLIPAVALLFTPYSLMKFDILEARFD